MRFLFLNQYGPPDPSPTARLLGGLADHLRARGHEVWIVSQSQDYHGRPAQGGGRLRRELVALATMFKLGWRATREKPDVILALSSPPGLLIVAAALARLRRVRLAHWAMDLYPELAVALEEIGPGVISRSLQVAIRSAYRQAALVVALDDDMCTHLERVYRVNCQVLAPWPPCAFDDRFAARKDTAASDHKTARPWCWLYSGNLGRAHEWETLLEAQRLLEGRGLPVHLVFQGDGAARRPAMERARRLGLLRCEWKGYVSEAELVSSLLAARVLVVTQRPQTRGLLWPSKLATLEKLPRPILFVGPVKGAIADRLRERGGSGVFAPGQAEAVARWVEEQFDIETPTVLFPQSTPSDGEGCVLLERWLMDCIRHPR